MFYFILAMVLILYYIFAAPQAIKGTLDLMLLVCAIVLLATFIILAIMRIAQSPLETWVGIFMILVGIWALFDISQMEKKGAKQQEKRITEKFLSKFF